MILSTDADPSHVFRKCMTDIWGDPVEKWENNTAEMTFSCLVESDWDVENLSVVAFIHNHLTRYMHQE